MTKNRKNNQSERFIEAAKANEADSSEADFDRVLKRIAKAPPESVQDCKTTKTKRPLKHAYALNSGAAAAGFAVNQRVRTVSSMIWRIVLGA